MWRKSRCWKHILGCWSCVLHAKHTRGREDRGVLLRSLWHFEKDRHRNVNSTDNHSSPIHCLLLSTLPTRLSVRSPWKLPSSFSFWLWAHVQVELPIWLLQKPLSIAWSISMLFKRQLYVRFNSKMISLDTRMFSDYGFCDIPRDCYQIFHHKYDIWYCVLSKRKEKKKKEKKSSVGSCVPLLSKGEWSYTHTQHYDGAIMLQKAKADQAF